MSVGDPTGLDSGPIAALGQPLPAPLGTSTRPGRSLRRCQLIADLAAAMIAAGIAVVCWGLTSHDRAGGRKLELFVVLAIALLFAASADSRARAATVGRMLSSDRMRFTRMAAGIILAGVVLMLAGLAGAFGPELPAEAILATVAVSLALLPAGRLVARELAAPVRVVLVGADDFGCELRARLGHARKVQVTAVIANSGQAFTDMEAIEHLCARQDADALLVAITDPISETAATIGRLPSELAGPVSRPDVAGLLRLGRRLPVSVAVQLPGSANPLLFRVGGGSKGLQRAVKRALDMAVSGLALVLLCPLLLLLAAWVLFDSGRPLLFRQKRLGHDRQPFHILKFRSMRPVPAPQLPTPREAPRGSVQKTASRGRIVATAADLDGVDTARNPLSHTADPMHVTRVGAILRRYSLDEIPQLFNVLRGEMSLVGPRPFVPAECAGLPAWSAPRFDVTPGLTGMWQVCGQHATSIEELCWLDLFYATCWSLGVDLRIALLTPARLLRGSR